MEQDKLPLDAKLDTAGIRTQVRVMFEIFDVCTCMIDLIVNRLPTEFEFL